MILAEIFTRFYKSFNFDFIRKNHESAAELPWERVDGRWYPYIRVPIERDITTIVGANESGKSHLLSAIEKGISGVNINREDFCRYSIFYTVEAGKRRWSDFGFKWCALDDSEREVIAQACEQPGLASFDHFYLFRENRDSLRAFIPSASGLQGYELKPEGIKSVLDLLPKPFRINADVALPSSVPIRWLASSHPSYTPEDRVFFGRKERADLIDTFAETWPQWASAESIKQNAPSIYNTFSRYQSGVHADTEAIVRRRAAEYGLAKDLICKVANIDPEAIEELRRAISEGLDGHVNGILQEINKALEAALNFPRWWVQDRAFSLRVDAREHDLVFTIRDRTQTRYLLRRAQ